MIRHRRIILCMALLALAPLVTPDRAASSQAARPISILISIDGWRWDYLDRYAPPTIAALAARGVRAEGLVPVYPSKTFPNHHSIVTGLHPDRHGIISNTIVDALLPGRFSLGNRDAQQDTRWWGGEPVWITAERQGRVAATMFWPGTDVEIAGRRPTLWRQYDHELPNQARVDQILVWLRRPEPERPTFLTLYFSTIDAVGHDEGPESPEMESAIREIDDVIEGLLAGLDASGLAARTNLVLVSDHGMAALSRDRTVVLDDYLDMSTVVLLDSSPLIGLEPRDGRVERVYDALAGKHPAMQVFTRERVPERYRLRHHPRLPAVAGVMDDGWHVTTRAELAREKEFPAGTHGYDPRHRSMHGLFIAAGPRFRPGLVVPAFENIHIYELLCRLLEIRPSPNDGDPTATAAFTR